MRNATNLRTFCFEDYHYAFQETLCPVTLAHIRSLYLIQVYIFIPLINSTPFLRFSHILLYTNFFLCTPGAPGMYITTQNIFLINYLNQSIIFILTRYVEELENSLKIRACINEICNNYSYVIILFNSINI